MLRVTSAASARAAPSTDSTAMATTTAALLRRPALTMSTPTLWTNERFRNPYRRGGRRNRAKCARWGGGHRPEDLAAHRGGRGSARVFADALDLPRRLPLQSPPLLDR